MPARPAPRGMPTVRIPRLLAAVLSTAVGLLLAPAAAAQPAAQHAAVEPTTVQVDVLPLRGPLDPAAAGGIVGVIEDANRRGVDLLVIQLDSPGALGADPSALVGAVRGSEVPVVVYVGPGLVQARAGGAAALLLAAAHLAAAAPDATVGPLLPLDLGGPRPGEAALLRAVIAARTDLEDLGDPTTVVLDAEQGRAAGLVDVIADGVDTLLVDLDGVTVTTVAGPRTLRIRSDEVAVRFTTIGLLRRVLHAATTPTLVYLALLAGLMLLVFEWFQPGFGVAGVAALVLLPIAGYGLAVLPVSWWAVAALVLGVAALAVDIAIAGLGVPTAVGTALLVWGSLTLYPSAALGVAGWIIGLAVATTVVFATVVVTVVLRAQAGPDPEVLAGLVGRRGVVRSTLNPEGHATIDGALWRVRWAAGGGPVRVGTHVEVRGVDGPVLLVGPVEDPDDGAPRPAAGEGSRLDPRRVADATAGATPDETSHDADGAPERPAGPG